MGCYLKHQAEDDSGTLPGTTINLAPTKTLEAARRLVRMEMAERGRSDEERERSTDSGHLGIHPAAPTSDPADEYSI